MRFFEHPPYLLGSFAGWLFLRETEKIRQVTHRIDSLLLLESLLGQGFRLIFSYSLLVLLEVRVVRLVSKRVSAFAGMPQWSVLPYSEAT